MRQILCGFLLLAFGYSPVLAASKYEERQRTGRGCGFRSHQDEEVTACGTGFRRRRRAAHLGSRRDVRADGRLPGVAASTLQPPRRRPPGQLTHPGRMLLCPACCSSAVQAWPSPEASSIRTRSLRTTECYQRALAIDPIDWRSHNNLGVLFKEAALSYGEAFKLNGLALAPKEVELFELSCSHYAAAIANGPPGCVANENMAVVKTDLGTRLKLAGATDRAVEAYFEALRYHNSYWPALFNLVRNNTVLALAAAVA